MELETNLNQVNVTLARFHGQEKLMRIGKNQFEISEKDPIFYLNGPLRKETRTGACTSCRDFVFESNSQMLFCQFCGNSNCAACLYKERMFPRGRINADGQKPKGKICKLCDHKFIVRQMNLETAMVVNKSKQEVRKLEESVEAARKELFILSNQRDQDRARCSQALNALDNEIEDAKLEIWKAN